MLPEKDNLSPLDQQADTALPASPSPTLQQHSEPSVEQEEIHSHDDESNGFNKLDKSYEELIKTTPSWLTDYALKYSNYGLDQLTHGSDTKLEDMDFDDSLQNEDLNNALQEFYRPLNQENGATSDDESESLDSDSMMSEIEEETSQLSDDQNKSLDSDSIKSEIKEKVPRKPYLTNEKLAKIFPTGRNPTLKSLNAIKRQVTKQANKAGYSKEKESKKLIAMSLLHKQGWLNPKLDLSSSLMLHIYTKTMHYLSHNLHKKSGGPRPKKVSCTAKEIKRFDEFSQVSAKNSSKALLDSLKRNYFPILKKAYEEGRGRDREQLRDILAEEKKIKPSTAGLAVYNFYKLLNSEKAELQDPSMEEARKPKRARIR